ncbi:NF-kappa-B inhibitor alpha-like [Saccostrea echinata]|uniref:NF-kappa-B inhibitor alpha-like n=1 Tax=Saccostrea echinata TaxID=191078 RepID=UPI002A80DD5B|nr:NF-kappa-B inhibitor alpha-like [Saccostrea echinata]
MDSTPTKSKNPEENFNSLETDCPFQTPGANREDSGFFSESFKESFPEKGDKRGLLKDIAELEENMECVGIKDDRDAQGMMKPEESKLSVELVMSILEQDRDGDTQLHMAIIQEMDIVAMTMIYLISNIDPELLDTPNLLLQTPLHLAVIIRSLELVEYLLQSGADAGSRDLQGNTPLHIACHYGYDDLVLSFLTCSNDRQNTFNLIKGINDRNYDGQTCLHLSTFHTSLPVIKLLTTFGADVNARDGKSGKTILHYAADNGNTILLDYILQLPGVDVNCRTYSGQTPSALARGRGHLDILSSLRRYGGKEYDNFEDT